MVARCLPGERGRTRALSEHGAESHLLAAGSRLEGPRPYRCCFSSLGEASGSAGRTLGRRKPAVMRRLRAVVGRVVRRESARVARRDSSAARKKFSVRDNLAFAVGVMSAVGCSDGFSGDGDRGEFEAFARRAAPSLLRSAFLLCGDRGHAEDLLQMTFWRTAQRWVLAREAPNAYAYRVLVNLSRDRRRGQRRRVSEWLGSDDRAGVDLDQSERFAQRDVMSRAVRRLPDRQREVIVLRFYLDLSIAQTAAALGSSEGTVKSHTARALTRMRELLGESPAGSSTVSAEVANAE